MTTLILILVAAVGCHGRGSKETERQAQNNDQTSNVTEPASSSQNNVSPLSVSTGGVIDGNGGEFIGNEHNPWFVGRASVPYCVTTSENFSLSRVAASAEIASAFLAWNRLLMKLQFDGVSRGFEGRETEIPRRQLARDFVEVDCAEMPPLQFKLGVFDKAVNAAMKFSVAKLIGLALRTNYDEVAGMARGFIWIAPDRGPQAYQGPKVAPDFWLRPQLFRNIIVHEIAHVLGLQHMSQSVLDARFPARAVETGFDEVWSGDEFHLNQYVEPGFCGEILNAEPEALREFWKITSADGVSVCLRWNDKLRGGDDNTPLIVTVKPKVGEKQEYIIRLQNGSVTDSWLVGLFPEAEPDGSIAYKRTWFGSLPASASYLGYFKHGNEQQPIKVEMPVPGAFALTLPFKGSWRVITIVASERRDFFLKLFKTLSEE